jgi:hypothetical protein
MIKHRYFIIFVFLPGILLLLLDPGKNLGEFRDYGIIRQSIMICLNAQFVTSLILPFSSKSFKSLLFNKKVPFKITTLLWVMLFFIALIIHLLFALSVIYEVHGIITLIFISGISSIYATFVAVLSFFIFRPKTMKP